MTRRLVSFVALVLGLAVVLVVVPSSPSTAAGTLTVKTRDDPADPQLLSTSFGRVTDVDLASVGTATGVTVTFSGAGLAIDTPVVAVGDLSSDRRVSVEVTALTGGFHTLDIQVTSTNSSTVSTSLPLMWAPGGTPIPATGALGGNYGNVDLYTFAGTSFEDRQLLTFLDGDTAFIGNPAKGRPVCKKASSTSRTGCVSYRMDDATGLVQIGGVIGRVAANGLSIYTNGIGRADDSEGETFNERTFSQKFGYPGSGKRYAQTWKWTYDNVPEGISSIRLTLRKNGTFQLATGYDGEKPTVRKGTYKLTAPGRLVLKGRFGTETHSFGVRFGKFDTADPKKGTWLTYGKGKHVDAFTLKAVK